MNRLLAALAATTALVLAMPAAARDMPGMPGMKMPAPAKKPAPAKPAKRPAAKKPVQRPAPRRASTPAAAPAADAMPGMTMPSAKPDSATPMPAVPSGWDKPAAETKGAPQGTQSMPGMDMDSHGDH